MSLIFDWIFSQYKDIPTYLIVLEMIGVLFGFLSVWYSKQENIWVFPTGIISTGIFVYILWVFGLLGDMMINAYYFVMSIYGWYVWSTKIDDVPLPISRMTKKEKEWALGLFVGTLLFVVVVYLVFEKFDAWTAYVDTLTTALFFVGMWLMARKKIENWIYWIIADIISIPLYFYKGLIFTGIQYLIFTIIAFYGYSAWTKSLNKNLHPSLK
ncbi:nicotinamide riboside transporter PnuC [Spongiimicrobium salis]|uniref:nicotinamide riboside transporter PnuC n=1 Tax=Spongiimicrobium salis TaxID=1667022 RepID=UPI00374C9FE7